MSGVVLLTLVSRPVVDVVRICIVFSLTARGPSMGQAADSRSVRSRALIHRSTLVPAQAEAECLLHKDAVVFTVPRQ